MSRSLKGGDHIITPPKQSPWGAVQVCDVLCPGVFLVSTASHGGTMIASDMVSVLSPAARKCGMRQNGWLCYEEDTEENIVLRELLDKKLWTIPERVKDKTAFEENINDSLRRYHPDYWRRRQSGLNRQKNHQETSKARPEI